MKGKSRTTKKKALVGTMRTKKPLTSLNLTPPSKLKHSLLSLETNPLPQMKILLFKFNNHKKIQ